MSVGRIMAQQPVADWARTWSAVRKWEGTVCSDIWSLMSMQMNYLDQAEMVREHKSTNSGKIASVPSPWVSPLSALSFYHLQSHLCRKKQTSLSSGFHAHFSTVERGVVVLTLPVLNWDTKAFSPSLAHRREGHNMRHWQKERPREVRTRQMY